MESGPRSGSSFAWLNVTQFLGALNDNVFKLLVIFLLVSRLGDSARTSVVAVSSIVFVVPFLLFSHAGGVLADRYGKRDVIVWMKGAEVCIMLAGLAAAAWGAHESLLYAAIFLMSVQSALFGPSKYGIVPEIVPPERLAGANGQLVGLTYLAIIIGSFLPSFLLLNVLGRSFAMLAAVCVALALAGLAASMRIARMPAQGAGQRFTPWFVADIFRTLRFVAGDRHLLLAVLGTASFMFLGAFVQQNALLYAQDVLKLDWIRGGYLFPVAAVGIALGALLSARVSGRNIEFGVVPLGAAGLAVASVLLGVVSPGVVGAGALILLLGVSAGLFIVPLDAFIQYRSPSDRRGEVLACASFLSFVGAALSAGLLVALERVFGLGAAGRFVVIGVLTAALGAAAVIVLPDFLFRFFVVVVTRCLYRIRTVGLENLPLEGPALLVPNHVTWVDSLILSAVQQRRIRFVMAREVYENRWMKPVFRLMRVLPISSSDSPRRLVESLQEARRALDEGYMVCIFAEGAITRTGFMHGFRPGMTRIVRGLECPIIPIHIGDAWGSIFSYRTGRMPAGFPKTLPYPVHVRIGGQMPSTATPAEIRAKIMELSRAPFDARRGADRNLGFAFVKQARARWFSTAISDTTGVSLSYGRALTAAIALGDALAPKLEGQDRVGVALPASAGGALVNLALTLRGHVTVNLNFTASQESVAAAAETAGLKSVITSHRFLGKMTRFTVPGDPVYLEDVMRGITGAAKAGAVLRALFAPAALLAKHRSPGADDPATVIFSSGSTGTPKGVVLSHHNILSNLESFSMVMRFSHKDVMCSILPFFHSFGYTCTLWCPVTQGFGTCFHPNPMDVSGVLSMLRERRLTILLGTPTFLGAYARRGERPDMASVRLVVAGAEKLRKGTADEFEAKFGIRPLEGYGTTEMSPVVSLNVPDVEAGGVRQAGTKDASIGHPIPGVAVKAVDPDTFDPLPPGKAGLLLATGPNVMLGYLGRPDLTAAAMRDGWYVTGDIGLIDEDGFMFIQDRLSRFSKIGGEMVPHMAIEDEYMRTLGGAERVLAVTSVVDESRGEQLVVLHTASAGDAAALAEIMQRSDIPNLWKPKRDCYVEVGALPMLGSGKLDLKEVKRLAEDRMKAKAG
ncbi:MAG: MFS transporter [Lentisphaerae bacterium]|nr:MFS transporter [Lentisphaerota bacterium]